MKHESYTKNGIHPITKMAGAAPSASPAKMKPVEKRPSVADKLYPKDAGLRGRKLEAKE